MKIDFHLHTRASFDCESDPAQIVDWAFKKGLDALAVTEHDSNDGYADLKLEAGRQGLFVIPGVEFTAARGTHYLVYLTPELPLPKNDLEMIDEVHARGGLVGVAHPYRSDTGLKYNQETLNLYEQSEIDQIFAKVDMIEIYNGKSSVNENAKAEVLAEKYPKLIRIAGSDSHHPSTVGCAHTIVPGFKFGSVAEMREQLESISTQFVVLPELNISTPARTIKKSIEGTRRLMVKFKPLIPKTIWQSGKFVYRTVTNRIAEKRASKSVSK